MIKTILNRKSVRKYTDEKISIEMIHTILEAGMSGPSAVNARDWTFIVVDDEERIRALAEISGRAAKILSGSKLAIVICGDMERAFPKAPDYWVINASIAGQNMTLAAEALGLGSVWLGIWPQQEKVDAQRAFFNLPKTIIPHSILSFGYPDDETAANKEKLIWEDDRVHYNQW